MILIYAGLLAPLTIFLYTTFIRALPTDYEEAALMDGASRLRVFWDVVMPLVRPVTATVVVIQGIQIWNDFFTPVIFLLGSGQQRLFSHDDGDLGGDTGGINGSVPWD